MLLGALLGACVWDGSGPSEDHPIEGVLRVDLDAPPGGDGLLWATAFQHPQDALDVASPGDEVWIAAGTYVSRESSDTSVLVMKDGVAVYGGFAGTETVRSDRNAASNEVVLDGADACWQVASGASDALIGGFTITGGTGDNGAGKGGGLLAVSVTNMTVTECTFTENSATKGGAGLYASRADGLTVTDCVFTQNTAPEAAAVLLSGCSTVEIARCDFSDSFPGSPGIHMGIYGTGIVVADSTFDCTGPGNIWIYHNASSGTFLRCTFTILPSGYPVALGFNSAIEFVDCRTVEN